MGRKIHYGKSRNRQFSYWDSCSAEVNLGVGARVECFHANPIQQDSRVRFEGGFGGFSCLLYFCF